MEFFLITRRYIWFLHNTPPLQVVRGTLEALATPVQSMGINHRGFHVFIYGRGAPGSSNCRSCFQKIRRIGNVWHSTILALFGSPDIFSNSNGIRKRENKAEVKRKNSLNRVYHKIEKVS